VLGSRARENNSIFRVLLAHPQEVMHKRRLVYCVRVMSVVCTRFRVPLQTWCSQYTQYTASTVCVAPPEDEQVMLKTCRDPYS
jgi:hypothetical protein